MLKAWGIEHSDRAAVQEFRVLWVQSSSLPLAVEAASLIEKETPA
jgi:hypothetical protein